MSALLFLYREVPRIELGLIEHVPRAQAAGRVPVVLSAGDPLRRHLADVRRVHEADLREGFGRVVLPDALDRKHPQRGCGMGMAVWVSGRADLP